MIVWSDQKGFSTYQVSLRRPVWTFEARLGCTACDDSILHQIHVPLIWNEWASGARFDYRSLLTSFLINISKYLFSIQRLTILCEMKIVSSLEKLTFVHLTQIIKKPETIPRT